MPTVQNEIPEDLLAVAGSALRRARGDLSIRFAPPWFFVWLWPRGVLAITVGRRIWVSDRILASGGGGIQRLIRHELAHVDQYHRLGVVPFLARYMFEYMSNRLRGHSHAEAYRAISFEVEAREAEDSAQDR